MGLPDDRKSFKIGLVTIPAVTDRQTDGHDVAKTPLRRAGKNPEWRHFGTG